MKKIYILYIAIGLLVLSVMPEDKLEIIGFSCFAAFLIYIHFKEKSQAFAKEFEVWLKNNENIRKATFNHELDKEYCRLYHDMKDPRLDNKTKEMLADDWRSILAKRKEQGLPETCYQYENLCVYHKTYF